MTASDKFYVFHKVLAEHDIVVRHKWDRCENCGAHVICGHCGNNCCNGGHGDGCPDECSSAFAEQEAGWKQHDEYAASVILSDRAVESLARAIALIADGPESGWGIYADLIRAHLPPVK